jgi:hypothetical protein
MPDPSTERAATGRPESAVYVSRYQSFRLLLSLSKNPNSMHFRVLCGL